MMDLSKLKHDAAIAAHGITLEQAHNLGVCINCKLAITTPGLIYSEAGAREYQISGTCERCFDNMWAEE